MRLTGMSLGRRTLILAALAVAALVVACRQEVPKMQEKKAPRSRELVREVLARHREDLIQSYDAVGVGIGKKELHDEDYVIVVYLAAPRRGTEDDVRVEGVPVVFRVTGRIHPLPRGETNHEE